MKLFLLTLLLSTLPTLISSASSPHIIIGTDATIQDLLTTSSTDTSSLLFLDFYAPWCGHCKKLAPVLDVVAEKVQGKMTIITIDSTVHKVITKEHGVRGFPTLMFYKGGVMTKYTGARTEASLVDFANRMSLPSTSDVASTDATDVQRLFDLASIAFVFSGPDSTIFKKLASSMQHEVTFGISTSPQLSAGETICKIEKGEANKCESTTNAFTEDELLSFIANNNFNIITELSSDNFSRLGKNPQGKMLAITAVKPSATSTESTITSVANVARTAETQGGSNFINTWINADKWFAFLKQFKCNEELPCTFVYDMNADVYYPMNANTTTDTDDALFTATYTKFLTDVDNKLIESLKGDKPGPVKKDFAFYWKMFMDQMPFSGIIVVAFVGMVAFVVYSIAYDDSEEVIADAKAANRKEEEEDEDEEDEDDSEEGEEEENVDETKKTK